MAAQGIRIFSPREVLQARGRGRQATRQAGEVGPQAWLEHCDRRQGRTSSHTSTPGGPPPDSVQAKAQAQVPMDNCTALDAGKLETIQDIRASVGPIERPPMCLRTKRSRANMKLFLCQKVCIGLECCIGKWKVHDSTLARSQGTHSSKVKLKQWPRHKGRLSPSPK